MDTPEWIEYQTQFDLPADHFQEIPEDTTKYCVIVEPRAHPRLLIVIKNFMYLLQKKGWGLIVFHSPENDAVLKEGLAGWSHVRYVPILESNMSIGQYNDLVCSGDFWDKLLQHNCHHALMFQVDTVLLKDNVDDFIAYDYVGAPWDVRWLGMDIGNGGLSLRNVFRMWVIARQGARTVRTSYGDRFLGNEDIFYSWHLTQNQAHLPTVEIAKQFSIETIWYDDPCGMHQPHIARFPSYEAFAALFSRRYLIASVPLFPKQ
jgi:hypothetical protein